MRQGDGTREDSAALEGMCPGSKPQPVSPEPVSRSGRARRRSDSLRPVAVSSDAALAAEAGQTHTREFAEGYAAYRTGDVYHVAYARAVQNGLSPGSTRYRAFIDGFFCAIRRTGAAVSFDDKE